MHAILRKFFVLILVFQSTLVTVPGFGRALAISPVQETEAPTQSIEKLEFIKAEVARQGRRSIFERRLSMWLNHPGFDKYVRSSGRLSAIANYLQPVSFLNGHRLHNGLLAPLRI
jgi:hypothetical protein